MLTQSTAPKSKRQLLDLYRQMQLIRRCEEQLTRSHQRGLIHGACHTYIGQEAIATGVCANLRRDDCVFSTHRGHGHALAKGVTPRELIAELYGRETGCSRGRGGSMHLFSPEVGLMGTSGIVGPAILHAVGGGYSFKLFKCDRVSVVFFGDGAVNNGAFHEGLNMAGIWNLPVVFVCENNQFATEVPFSYSSGSPMVGNRAEMYGLAGYEIDGNDVLAVHEAADEAIQRARAGGGASLIECRTYRTRPHAEGMEDFTYRSKEEVQEWKSRCPIARIREQILEEDDANASYIKEIDDEIKQQIEESHQFAEQSPWPDPATASTYVYADPKQQDLRLNNDTFMTSPGKAREITFMKATHEALAEEMEKNPNIFVMGEGIGKRGGNFNTTMGLYDLYGGDRLCDTPICERGFVGLSAGAAMTGTRPVIDFMFADFILDSMGEIINQVAKMQYMSSARLKMPVLLRGCIGIGHSAATHHSGSYYSTYANFPGLRVVVPSNPRDAKGLLKKALTCDDPVLFLEHKELLAIKDSVPEEEYTIDFGQAAVVREGTDVTVVAIALMVHHTIKASDNLAQDNISVELIDPRTVAPLDIETILQSVSKTGRLLVVDETFGPCGIGSEIVAQVADRGFEDLDAPIRRLNGVHTPTPYSPPLEAAVVPNPESIEQAIRSLMAE